MAAQRLQAYPAYRPDSRKLTVHLDEAGTRGFSLTVDQLLKEKSFWLPELDVFVSAGDSPDFLRWLEGIRLEAAPGVLNLDGQDIRNHVRTPEITALASQLATLLAVRTRLVALQRQAARGRSLVCEGRDQGTVVFPEAECKFFLNADRVERARRRHRELQSRGQDLTLDVVLAAQDERDRRDAERALSPLKPADGAILIDSTGLSPDEVVNRMENEVRRCASLTR
jgi:cytidylate kinase